MSYVIGLDIGTSSSKAIIVDVSNHQILASAVCEHELLIPKPLWAEQWPEGWLKSSYQVIKECTQKAKVNAKEVKAIAISSLYGGSGVPVGKDMEPVAPCLIWMDRRAEAEVQWVKDNIDLDKLFDITGNYVNSYYGYAKMLWFKKNQPDIWKKIRYFVPPNNYIAYKMTGNLAVDLSSAANIGGIYDINTHTWSEEMLQVLGIPRELCPDNLVECSDIVGGLLPKVAEELGLTTETLVIAGGIDAPVATFASGVLQKSDHVAMMGTSTCWGFLTEKSKLVRDMVSMPYVINCKKEIYSFGGASTSGALVNWFRQNFGETDYTQLEQYIKTTPAGAEGLLVLPYFMGERSPIWDAYASGVFFGLGLHHKKEHIYRAILESVAFSLRHNIELAQSQQVKLSEDLIVVGGTSKSDGWLQIISDITNRPVKIIKEDVEAPLGDAVLAALGAGLISDVNIVKQWGTLELKAQPSSKNQKLYDDMFGFYKQLYMNTKDQMKALKNI